jgi:glycosyltransferase involved in cell wall biosynthesis
VVRLGLQPAVEFAGYLEGAAYVRALAGLDAQLLLVPGSDPTCRALREGMALAVPSIAFPRGQLPEIVQDGETGLLSPESAEGLAHTMRRLATEPALASRLGAAARTRAAAQYDARVVAATFEAQVLERIS